MNPDTMTLDECRDWIALNDGWVQDTSVDFVRWVNGHERREVRFHPFPATIDAAAKALPEGWSVKVVSHKGNTQATAWPSRLDRCPPSNSPYATQAVFDEADTELLARFRLAVKCRLAVKGTP